MSVRRLKTRPKRQQPMRQSQKAKQRDDMAACSSSPYLPECQHSSRDQSYGDEGLIMAGHKHRALYEPHQAQSKRQPAKRSAATRPAADVCKQAKTKRQNPSKKHSMYRQPLTVYTYCRSGHMDCDHPASL